jgi:hypothetical protein
MFHCKSCIYSTSKKSEFNRHLKTKKHLRNAGTTPTIVATGFTCDGCLTTYVSRQGLWRHQKSKSCGTIQDDDYLDEHESSVKNIVTENVITEDNEKNTEKLTFEQQIKLREIELEEKKLQIQQDIEMKNIQTQQELMQEMCNNQKMMASAIEKIGSTQTVNNTTNNIIHTINQFNLNVFLNDTCKDAMNIMDFVKSLKYTEEDIGSIGKLGYAEAISNLLIKGLNEIDVTQRPIHCTDAKREKLYVKHDNEWKKDIESAGNLKKAIKVVGHQNMGSLDEWKEKHPYHNEPNSRHHIEYLEICNQTMNGMLDEDDKEYKKIIKRIAPETLIEKDNKVGQIILTETINGDET